MTISVGLMTELDLVNGVLSVAGDAPIQALNDTYQPVFIIRKMLNNASKKLQSKTYWFNTEYEVTLTPNTINSKIILPANLLRFEPCDVRYVARGLSVYDRTSRTTIITEDVIADLSVQLSFEELPEVAREHLLALCRLQYNNEYFGETSFLRELTADVKTTKQELDKENIENENVNMFDSQRSQSIAFKNRRR